MIDYSTLTDAELSERVALVCGWEWIGRPRHYLGHWYNQGCVVIPEDAWASSLNAVFGPHGPAQWLREHHGYSAIDTHGVWLSAVLDWWCGRRGVETSYRDIPNREARAFCEAFLAVAEQMETQA